MVALRKLTFTLIAALAFAVPAGQSGPCAASAPAWRAARLSIEARPPVAVRVFMNGRRLGTTPIANTRIRPGRYVLEAIRPDGARIRRVMRLHPAQNAKVVVLVN